MSIVPYFVCKTKLSTSCGACVANISLLYYFNTPKDKTQEKNKGFSQRNKNKFVNFFRILFLLFCNITYTAKFVLFLSGVCN